MRHLVLALMIALLPIRGWVGDVMATDMASGRAAQLVPASDKLDAYAQGTGAQHPAGHGSQSAAPVPDCHGHGAGTSSPGADTQGESFTACQACQACHSVALSPLTLSIAAAMALTALPRAPAARFASAITARGQKPPIA